MTWPGPASSDTSARFHLIQRDRPASSGARARSGGQGLPRRRIEWSGPAPRAHRCDSGAAGTQCQELKVAGLWWCGVLWLVGGGGGGGVRRGDGGGVLGVAWYRAGVVVPGGAGRVRDGAGEAGRGRPGSGSPRRSGCSAGYAGIGRAVASQPGSPAVVPATAGDPSWPQPQPHPDSHLKFLALCRDRISVTSMRLGGASLRRVPRSGQP